jgi:prolyl-tRNA synthetase
VIKPRVTRVDHIVELAEELDAQRAEQLRPGDHRAGHGQLAYARAHRVGHLFQLGPQARGQRGIC